MPDFARVFRACVLCFAPFAPFFRTPLCTSRGSSAQKLCSFHEGHVGAVFCLSSQRNGRFPVKPCDEGHVDALSCLSWQGNGRFPMKSCDEGHVGAVFCLSSQRNGRFPMKPCDERHVGAVSCLSSQEIKPEMLCCFDCRLLSGQFFEAGEIITVSPRMTASLKPASSIAFRPLSVRPFGVVTRWISSSGSD